MNLDDILKDSVLGEIPQKAEIQKLNSHVRDKDISFEKEAHVYTVRDTTQRSCEYVSVTRWVGQQFEGFDADKVIDKMMNGRNWTSSQYFGKTRDEIKDKWSKSKDEASAAGTKLHYDIECYYKNEKVENESPEWSYFTKFLAEHPNLKPYRSEWMVYDNEL